MSDRILAIGIEAEHERIECGAFHAVTPLTDFACAVVDPTALSELWRSVEPGPHGRLTTNAETDGGLGRTLIRVVRRRREEAAELVTRGGTLVCILQPVGRPLSVRRRTKKGPAVSIVHTYSWLPEAASLSRLVIAGEEGGEIRPVDADSLAWQLIEAQGDRGLAVVWLRRRHAERKGGLASQGPDAQVHDLRGFGDGRGQVADDLDYDISSGIFTTLRKTDNWTHHFRI